MAGTDKERLQELKARIDAAAASGKEADLPKKYNSLTASRIVVEMFSGVLVGGGIGYYIDKWLGTLPLFFISLLLLGLAAAIINIYKLSAEQASEESKPTEKIE